MKKRILALLAGLVLVPAVASGTAQTTYRGFESYKPSMPLMINAHRNLVVTQEAPMCKFISAPKHPLGRISVAQKIESLIRQGEGDSAMILIDESVTDGTCFMSTKGDQLRVTGMLMASDCNGEYEPRSNVEQGLGVFAACFYLPIVKVKGVEYATLAVSLRNFDTYASIYLRKALMRKGIIQNN